MNCINLGCLIYLTLSTASSNSQRSQCCNCSNYVVTCDTCSSHYTDEAAKQIQSVLRTVINRDCALANPACYPTQYHPKDRELFDFIVVGGGAAGSVMANRLSEVPGWNVLLLEAGGDPTKTTEVPALLTLLPNTPVDWKYKSNPNEDNCLGMNGRMCNLPRGKVLGGSSTINNMFYVRGNAKDFDGWAADGNAGWRYEDVLPYFKKLEDMRDEKVQELPYFNKYHNKGGPLKAEPWPNKEVEPLAQAFSEGMNELGYPVNYDINGPSQSGYVQLQGSLENGRRCSSAKAYLTPVRRRGNLKVSKFSLVIKVLIDDKKTAYGVLFVNECGKHVTVRARKEVILSAGAFNSPQLLMLSGIGPAEHLQKFNIPVVQDLPVGKNLQDHVGMVGLVITVDFEKPAISPEESMFDFLLRNDSSYTSIGLSTYILMINVSTELSYGPNIEIVTTDFAKNDTTRLKTYLDTLNVKDEIINYYLEIVQNSYMIIVATCVLSPFSRGFVELRNRDPKSDPNIVAGYYTDQNDIDIQLHTYDFLYSLVDTKGMKNINAKLHEIKIPACMQYPFTSNSYRVCALRHLSVPLHHQCGTCKMGPAGSPDSVVDPQLRVKGIRNLRVVDASVMRKVPRAHTSVPVMMLGEKGADLVKAYWLRRKS